MYEFYSTSRSCDANVKRQFMKMLEISSLENIQGGCEPSCCNPLGSILGCLGGIGVSLVVGIAASAGGCGCGGLTLGVGVCAGVTI